MKPPDIEDALTNELMINRLSQCFAKIYGLPAVRYKFSRYLEEHHSKGITVLLYLQHEKISVVVQLEGPAIIGELDWGLKIGDQYLKKEQNADGGTTYTIQGYLKPA